MRLFVFFLFSSVATASLLYDFAHSLCRKLEPLLQPQKAPLYDTSLSFQSTRVYGIHTEIPKHHIHTSSNEHVQLLAAKIKLKIKKSQTEQMKLAPHSIFIYSGIC